MKIVYLLNNTWFPGGQTRVLANKVNYWVEHGHEVFILTADQIGYPPYYPIDSRVKMIDFAIGYMGADQLGLGKDQEAFPLPCATLQATQPDSEGNSS